MFTHKMFITWNNVYLQLGAGDEVPCPYSLSKFVHSHASGINFALLALRGTSFNSSLGLLLAAHSDYDSCLTGEMRYPLRMIKGKEIVGGKCRVL